MAKGKNQKDQANGIISIRINTYSRWFNLCVILICFLVLFAVRLQVNQGTSGDEPHYLLMDYSLIHYHDLSLAKAYKNKDYQSYYPYLLQPQGVIGAKPGYAAKEYSTHGIGLPIFLLPGFYLDSKNGAVFEMVLLATAVVCLTWVWVKQVTNNRKAAYLTSAFLVITYFFNGLVGYIYPDILIAALILISLIIVERYYQKPIFQFVLGLALGLMLLAHFKTMDTILPILLVFSYQLWHTKRKLPWITVSVVALFVLYFFYTLHHWFGVYNLSVVAGGQGFGANPIQNTAAMLFDSNRGLLIYSPIMLLLFVGIPLWFKKHNKSLIITLIAVVPPMVVLATIPSWTGGESPTNRYLMELLPAFMPALAFALIKLRSPLQRVVICVLAGITLLASLDATIRKVPLINGSILMPRAPLFAQIQQHTGIAIDKVLLNFSAWTTLPGHHEWIKEIIDYLFVLGLFIYGCYLSKFSINHLPRHIYNRLKQIRT